MNAPLNSERLDPHARAEADPHGDVIGLSRRAFLLSSGGLAIGIAFGGLGVSRRAQAQAAPFAPNGWMHVGTDGIVTIYSPASEMGQGTMNAIPLLIAEEMDLDWSKVRVEQAPSNPRTFGNPRFGGGMTTGASRTVQGYYHVVRIAGLQARYAMMAAAAKKWGVPMLEVDTRPHMVVHAPSGRTLGYGEIATFATAPAGLPQYTEKHLKPTKALRLIGKDLPRVDVPSKTNGTARYGIDVRQPGILYGAVLRAPVQGEKPESVDDSAARKVAGVKAVVTLPYGVGVVAENYHAARQAKAALKVSWSSGAKARAYSSDKVMAEYLARARNTADKGVEYERIGDPDKGFAGAAKTLSAEYTSEHTAHICLEPMNATARVDGERIEVWAPSQSPFFVTGTLTRGLGYKPENITCHITLLGGGFGRRIEGDFISDAALLAKAVPGVPVKVIWSREDDIQHDKYRPLTAQHLSGGLDAQGNLVALQHRLVCESIYARAAPPLFAQAGGRDSPACEGAFHLKYGVPHRVMNYLREQRGIDVGFWRGVGGGYTKFALECFIDELAAAAGKDPAEFRLTLLAGDPRAAAVMREVMQMAEWSRKRADGRALGIAYSDMWNSHIAQVAEVSLDRKSGRPRVHQVWSAVDCGVPLQPRNVESQIESSIMYGLSALLGEKVTFKDGVVQQSNLHDYPVLRMNEAPRVVTRVIPTDHYPGGIGEVGLPPLAPAVAGALFTLTGKRLRALPFDPGLLKA